MCSNRWAKPVRPFGSMRKPMLYMTSTSTTGALRSSLTTTFRPFGSVKYSTGHLESRRDSAPAPGRARAASRTAITVFVTNASPNKKFQSSKVPGFQGSYCETLNLRTCLELWNPGTLGTLEP